ncbi:unnamed protein product, partial [Urochloa humidicola]
KPFPEPLSSPPLPLPTRAPPPPPARHFARSRRKKNKRAGLAAMAGGGMLGGAFWATRALEVVKRNDGPGLLWKRIKLTTTRKNNAKKRLKRLWQNEAVIRACGQSESSSASNTTSAAEKQQ